MIDHLPFALMPIEAFFDHRLTLRQLKVLGALLSFRNRSTGLIYPSRESIAARTGLPLSRISTTTTELVALGWLRKVGKGGKGVSCRYAITTPPDITQAVSASIASVKELKAECETVTDSVTVTDLETVTDLAPNGYRISNTNRPEQIYNPHPTRTHAKASSTTQMAPSVPTTPEREPSQGSRLTLTDLPPDWAQFCATKRPDLNPSEVWERFRDYWNAQAGAKARKADWFAAWRYWINTEKSAKTGARYEINGNTRESASERRARLGREVIARGYAAAGIDPKQFDPPEFA